MENDLDSELFPAKKKCFVRDCSRTSIVFWSPEILIWARGHSKKKTPPAVLRMGVYYCDDCKRIWEGKARAEFFTDWLPEENRHRLRDGFRLAGKADPDFETAEIRWARK